MRVLQELALPEVTEQDLLWLIRALEGDYSGQLPQHILEDLAAGKSWLWRITGKAEGVVAARAVVQWAGPALVLEAFAGKGVFPGQARHIWADLEEWARERGFRRVIGYNVNRRIDKLYERVCGAPPRATEFVREL